MAPQQNKIKKIKFRKWEPQTYNFRKHWKTNKDLPQVYSIKRTCGRGTTAGKGSEDEPQVYSIKKTCGSEAEARGRQHRVSPYICPVEAEFYSFSFPCRQGLTPVNRFCVPSGADLSSLSFSFSLRAVRGQPVNCFRFGSDIVHKPVTRCCRFRLPSFNIHLLFSLVAARRYHFQLSDLDYCFRSFLFGAPVFIFVFRSILIYDVRQSPRIRSS